MTDIAKIAIQADTSGLTNATAKAKNELLKLTAQEAKLTAQQSKLAATTAKLAKTHTSEVKAALIARQAQQKYAIALSKTNIEATKAANSIDAAKQSTIAAGKATSAATPKMQGFGHQSRMVSMQLSQVAQQGSVTGNYLQALAIQLPDLMLGFGAVGILIGAVAGSLAMVLIPALTGSNKELEKFNDLIDETKEGLKSVRIESVTGAIDTLKASIKEASEEMDRLQNIPNKMGGRTLSNNRRLAIQADRLEKVRLIQEEQIKNEQALAVLEKKRADIEKSTDDTTASEAAEAELEARRKLAEGLKAIEQGQESPAQRAVREATERATVIQAAQDAELDSIKSYDQLKKDNAQRLADDLIAITQKEQEQKNQILTAGQQASLSVLGGLFGQMASIAQQGGEKMFQSYKNLATAQALISTSLAVANTLANPLIPPPYNFALAGAVGAMGLVQVGMIQNQKYQGARAMGGQVESGGRYLVGENGPEVLQLGSQGGAITPNHSMGGEGTNITNVFNIQSGVTKQEVQSLIPSIVRATKQSVQSEMGKGGTMSRSIGRRA